MTKSDLDLEMSWGISQDQAPEAKFFEHWFAVVAAATGRRGGLGIRIVDEAEGRELNRQYRRADRATNVLSFAADVPEEIPVALLGDLVICAPVVVREAAAQSKQIEHHWAHMVVHGLLHLCGYDHEDPEEADQMENLERQILAESGIPDPYD